jgi:hypothetical protein
MKKIPIQFDCLNIDIATGLLSEDKPFTLIYLFTRHGILYYGLTLHNADFLEYSDDTENYPLSLFEEVIMHSQVEEDTLEFMQLGPSSSNMFFDDHSYQYYGKLDFKTKSYERYKLPTMEGQPARLSSGGILTNIKYGYERND